MSTYKKLILPLFVICLVSVHLSYAQSDNQAGKILDDFSTKIKSFSAIEADFSFSLENKEEDITDSFDGNIIIYGSKYKLQIMGTDTYFNGKTMWSHMPDIEEVTISEPDTEENSMFDPAKIFTIYKEGFTLQYNGEKNGNYLIKMIPEDTQTPYSKIDIQIIKKNLQLFSIRYTGKDGNDYFVKIKSFKSNPNYTESTFIFKPDNHPGVEVIDLR